MRLLSLVNPRSSMYMSGRSIWLGRIGVKSREGVQRDDRVGTPRSSPSSTLRLQLASVQMAARFVLGVLDNNRHRRENGARTGTSISANPSFEGAKQAADNAVDNRHSSRIKKSQDTFLRRKPCVRFSMLPSPVMMSIATVPVILRSTAPRVSRFACIIATLARGFLQTIARLVTLNPAGGGRN
jgi:hypothetical protein